ncbi:MAG: DNA repair protein RecO [Deltaproteobacteria bacterium]|nr:DNA repair protein RecO [Deltaproteobacteria bacterium]
MKRGLFKAEAIILNSLDYGESDRILTFYTLEHGKIRGIAKGARRSRKRFVGNLEPMSHIDLIFFHTEKSELMRVEDAHLIESFPNLKVDIDRLSRGCYLIELVSEMTREGQASPPVFQLLSGFLKVLDNGGDLDVFTRFFEIRLLAVLGYLPHLAGCVVCKNRPDEPLKKFSSERGGIVCRSCGIGVPGLVPVSSGTAGLLAMAAKLDLDKLSRLKVSQAFIDESERLLYDFIKFQIGKELKTKRFLDKMRSASVRA